MRGTAERLVADRGPAVVAVLVVLGLLAFGVGVAGYNSTETTEVTEREDTRTFGTELDESAVVTGNTSLYERGTRLEDAPVYLTDATPVLDLTLRTSVPADRTVSVDQKLHLEYVATRGGDVFWRNSTVLASNGTTVEDGNATVRTSLDVTEVRNRLSAIKREIGSAGDVSVRLAVSVTYRSDDAEGTIEETAPLRFERTSYRVGNAADERTHSKQSTREVEVPAGDRGTEKALMGLGVLALLGAVATGTLYWRRYRHLDREDVTLAVHRRRYAEWISTGSAPVDPGTQVVEVDTLEDLVDVAIDSDERVIHDRSRGVYVVFHDGLVYRFSPGGSPVDSPGGSPVEADDRDRSPDEGSDGSPGEEQDRTGGGTAADDRNGAADEGPPENDGVGSGTDSPGDDDVGTATARLDGGVPEVWSGPERTAARGPLAPDRGPGGPRGPDADPPREAGDVPEDPQGADTGSTRRRDAVERTEGLESDDSGVDDDASAGDATSGNDGSAGDPAGGEDAEDTGPSRGDGDDPTSDSGGDPESRSDAEEDPENAHSRNQTDPREYDVNELRSIAAGEPSSFEGSRPTDDASSPGEAESPADPTGEQEDGPADGSTPEELEDSPDSSTGVESADSPAADPGAGTGDSLAEGTDTGSGGRAAVDPDPATAWFRDATVADGATSVPETAAGWGSGAIDTPSDGDGIRASNLFGTGSDAAESVARWGDGVTDDWTGSDDAGSGGLFDEEESGGGLFDDDSEQDSLLEDLGVEDGAPDVDVEGDSFDLVDPQPDEGDSGPKSGTDTTGPEPEPDPVPDTPDSDPVADDPVADDPEPDPPEPDPVEPETTEPDVTDSESQVDPVDPETDPVPAVDGFGDDPDPDVDGFGDDPDPYVDGLGDDEGPIPATESDSDAVAESGSDATAETIPDATTETTPDAAAESSADAVTGNGPDRTDDGPPEDLTTLADLRIDDGEHLRSGGSDVDPTVPGAAGADHGTGPVGEDPFDAGRVEPGGSGGTVPAEVGETDDAGEGDDADGTDPAEVEDDPWESIPGDGEAESGEPATDHRTKTGGSTDVDPDVTDDPWDSVPADGGSGDDGPAKDSPPDDGPAKDSPQDDETGGENSPEVPEGDLWESVDDAGEAADDSAGTGGDPGEGADPADADADPWMAPGGGADPTEESTDDGWDAVPSGDPPTGGANVEAIRDPTGASTRESRDGDGGPWNVVPAANEADGGSPDASGRNGGVADAEDGSEVSALDTPEGTWDAVPADEDGESPADDEGSTWTDVPDENPDASGETDSAGDAGSPEVEWGDVPDHG